jgi:polyisoprenoid-binding protein YceI
VDPAHSSVGFSVRHLGVSKVRGRFTRFEADVVVGETLDSTSVTATIDIASIDTGDAAHSSVGFTIRHLGVSKVRGHFRRFDVDVVVGGTADTTTVTAEIDVASIDTGNPDRDAHVLSPDLLDAAVRPTLAFRSTGLRGAGSDWRLDGELTIGAVTRPVSLGVELGGIEAFVDGRRHAGFEARTEIRRSDFGIDLALPPGVSTVALGDVVKVELDLQLIEPEA